MSGPAASTSLGQPLHMTKREVKSQASHQLILKAKACSNGTSCLIRVKKMYNGFSKACMLIKNMQKQILYISNGLNNLAIAPLTRRKVAGRKVNSLEGKDSSLPRGEGSYTTPTCNHKRTPHILWRPQISLQEWLTQTYVGKFLKCTFRLPFSANLAAEDAKKKSFFTMTRKSWWKSNKLN